MKILLPTDGSENAHRAGEYAISNAELGADIIILYVINTDHLDVLHQRDLREHMRKELANDGERIINNFKQEIEDSQCQGQCKDVNIITLIKEGKPEDVILRTIDEEDIDQVIMGKSGKSGLDKLYVGSTTERVVRNSNVPVNVI
ncbi:MAG: universal stress protein, partial [Methanobacterium sp.]